MTETEASKVGLYLAAPSLPPPGILSPASPTTIAAATMSTQAAPAAEIPRPLVARRSLRQEKSHSSFSSTVGSSLPAPLMTANLGVVSRTVDSLPISASNNSLDTPCSAGMAMSPFSSLDALSQSLLNIETQMRRPSFLMNRRTSILSTLFATNSIALEQYDRQDQPSPFPSTDSLTIEPAEVEPSNLFVGVPKERCEENGAGPLDTLHCVSESVQAMDWRAWHGSWIRRRIRPEDDSSIVILQQHHLLITQHCSESSNHPRQATIPKASTTPHALYDLPFFNHLLFYHLSARHIRILSHVDILRPIRPP
ncbi:hypothetical protein BGZ97_001646 [Linnemannia gamsii]|uniref:Uncharacterized protein n=1 Tax=Linnemannia gamsii TaxID=64522 RepID=A0A9P6QXG1_9FUNG|nr:hypothetical protein BGZ97_001646 [Linnemannia gamsii]